MSLSIGRGLLFALNQYYYINSYDNNKHQNCPWDFIFLYILDRVYRYFIVYSALHRLTNIKGNIRLTLLVLLFLNWDNPFQFTWTKGELLPSLGVRRLSYVVCSLSSVVCRLSSVVFSSFFSETTGPIGTKLSRNVPWMVLYKVSVFRSSRIFNMAARANNML